MVLDSQLTRDGTRHRHMTARQRGPVKSWLGVAGLAIAVIGGVVLFWWAIFSGDTDTPAPDGDTPPVAVDPDDPAPEDGGDVETPRPVYPAPAEDDQQDTVTQDDIPDTPSEPVEDATMVEQLSSDTETPTMPDEPDEPEFVEDTSPPAPPAQPDYEPVPGPLGDLLAEIGDTTNRIKARALMNGLLTNEQTQLREVDRDALREAMTEINRKLVYSKTILRNDPLVETHIVRSGDRLSRIGKRFKIGYRFLAAINELKSPDRILVGQKLKIVRGPFHAVIDMSAFRMDLYLTDKQGRQVYINSLPVGLGEDDSTPPGRWIVKTGSKVKNPQYTDPITGKTYARNDKDNPIGEYWIGLEGIEEKTADLRGYGIHGTIDPDSIGRQASMGCVRLGKADMELLYSVLIEGESTITIKP